MTVMPMVVALAGARFAPFGDFFGGVNVNVKSQNRFTPLSRAEPAPALPAKNHGPAPPTWYQNATAPPENGLVKVFVVPAAVAVRVVVVGLAVAVVPVGPQPAAGQFEIKG